MTESSYTSLPLITESEKYQILKRETFLAYVQLLVQSGNLAAGISFWLRAWEAFSSRNYPEVFFDCSVSLVLYALFFYGYKNLHLDPRDFFKLAKQRDNLSKKIHDH